MCDKQTIAAIESCIYNTSHLGEFYLKYFNLLAQVVSYRKSINCVTGKAMWVLRVWDAFTTRNETDCFKASWLVDLGTESIVTPPAAKFERIPLDYFYDILLFGEWIKRAESLKSGDIVVLKNVHFFKKRYNIRSVLALHEGTFHGRDIIKIEPAFYSHYRCIKLINDLQGIIDNYRGAEFAPATFGMDSKGFDSERSSNSSRLQTDSINESNSALERTDGCSSSQCTGYDKDATSSNSEIKRIPAKKELMPLKWFEAFAHSFYRGAGIEFNQREYDMAKARFVDGICGEILPSDSSQSSISREPMSSELPPAPPECSHGERNMNDAQLIHTTISQHSAAKKSGEQHIQSAHSRRKLESTDKVIDVITLD